MKKITSFALILITLFSCLFFVACGDKYSKLKMSFYYTNGEAITELVLIKDDYAEIKKETERVGVKFEGIDENDIDQILVYSSPIELITTSNYIYDGSIVYVDVNANFPATGDLVVKHLASGKTETVPLRVEQKSNNLIKVDKRYIVSVNEDKFNTEHYLKPNELVQLLPEGSTDIVLFEYVSGTILGVELIEEVYETDLGVETYVVGFKISDKANFSYQPIKLRPVTKMAGYDRDVYGDDKVVEVYFERILSDENVILNTDDDHKDTEGNIFETIYLIANDNNIPDGKQYSHDTAKFKLETDKTKIDKDLDKYLEDYSLEVLSDNSRAVNCDSNIGNGEFAVNAITHTDDRVKVTVRLIPAKVCGDVNTITKTIYIKGEVRSDVIEVKKNKEVIDVSETVDIYNYIATGNSNGLLFEMQALANNGVPVFGDLNKMRITIAPEIIYSTKIGPEWSNIYEDNTFETKLSSSVDSFEAGRFISNQKNLIRIVNGNEYLKFYYDDVIGTLVSETFESYNDIYIKYVETANSIENEALSLNVISKYEGSLVYLQGMEATQVKINFDKKEGVKSLDLFAGSFVEGAGGTIHTPVIDEFSKNVKAEKLYLDKDSETGYEVIFTNESIKGLNDRVLVSDVVFDVVITYNNATISNPLDFKNLNNNKVIVESLNASSLYLVFDINENTSIGEYKISFRQPDTGFRKDIICYVYKSFDITDENSVKFEFGEEDLDLKSFKNEEFKHLYAEADYIVPNGKILNLNVVISQETISSNIISGYSYSTKVVNVDKSLDDTLDSKNYLSCETSAKNPGYAQLTFIQPTYIKQGETDEENIHYSSIEIVIYSRTYENILTPKAEPEETHRSINFFVYEELKVNKNVWLNNAYLTKYMSNYLGGCNIEESVAELEVVTDNEILWNYIQNQTIDGTDGYKVFWAKSLSNTQVKVKDLKEKSIKLQCDEYGSLKIYTFIATGFIKQFYQTLSLECEITVKKPILTEELYLNNTDAKFNQIATNNSGQKVFEYTVDLKQGETFTVDATQFSSLGEITHPGLSLIVANNAGSTAQDAVRVDNNTIIVDKIQSGLKLIVMASDVLKEDVRKFTSGFQNPDNLIIDYYDDVKGYPYKHAYVIINLHLEDGKTKETAYSIYNVENVEEMLRTEVDNRFYRIMNNIDLANLTLFNNEFNGHIFGENNNIYNLYNVKLDNRNTNLFKTFNGSMQYVNFEVDYSYSNPAKALPNLGLIGELKLGAELTNVTALISGDSNFGGQVNKFNFGGLVGLNSGTIKYTTNDVIGVKGYITLSGDAAVMFGGIAGENVGNILGVNNNTSTIDASAEGEISFVAGSETQGALSMLNITSTLTNVTSTIDYSSALGSAIGGLIGINHYGSLKNAFVAGEIKASNTNNVGGAIGISVKGTLVLTRESNNRVVINSDNSNISHVKSNVVIVANNNVGGITGYDEYGIYDSCWYQILPLLDTAITASQNVGGIVGYAMHSKTKFCSVMSYRWDYSDDLTTVFSEDADIIGSGYVGGIFGKVANAADNLDLNTTTFENVSVITYSSVNAYLKSYSHIGALYTSNDSTYNGIVYSAYFIGKLSGIINYETSSTIEGSLCLDNMKAALYGYVYTINADSTGVTSGYTPKDDGNFNINGITTIPFWKYYEGMNANYIYISSDETENKPIFELVPNSLDVRIKSNPTDTNPNDDDESDKLELFYYDFSIGTANEAELTELNKLFNTKNIKDIFSFIYSPAGNIRINVKSSNENIVSVVAGELIITGTGTVTLEFSPVLNPTLKDVIEVSVVATLDEIVVSEDSTNKLENLYIAKGASKQLYVTPIGYKEVNYGYEYRTFEYKANTQFGLLVKVEHTNTSINVNDYVKIGGLEDKNNADNILEVYIPYGTPFSVTALKSDGKFDVTVTPCVYEGRAYDCTPETFKLYTKLGASEISLNYNSAIVYPNDITELIAIVKTDIKLEETAILKLVESIYNNDNKLYSIDNIISDLSKYLVLKSYDNYDRVKEIQTIVFTVNIGEDLLTKNTDGNYEPTEFKINFKSEYSSMETVEYTILPQKIDKIEAKGYIYKNFAAGEIEESEVLKPNALGLLIINVSPINGYFEYLEISDVTGNEEIKFMQLTSKNGNSLDEIDRPSVDGKGIKIIKVDQNNDGVADDSSMYVTMQIDKGYSSKVHTLKLVAYYKGQPLKVDYKYVDVKMLPSINVEYQLPNGTNIDFETDNTGVGNFDNNLYFANGTSAQFRITTANANTPLIPKLSGYITNNFELVNTHGDFYILKCINPTSDNLGKTITIELETKAVMDNGDFEVAKLTLTFTVVNYVIHSTSITKSNSNNEIYGTYDKNVKLEVYFKATDISYYNNGTYHDTVYTYDASIEEIHPTDKDDVVIRKSINNILKELNINYEEYWILNKGVNPNYQRVNYKTNDDKYIKADSLDKVSLIDKTLIVSEDYNKKVGLAIDFELKLTSTYNWEISDKVDNTLDVSRNYKLNFSKFNLKDEYKLVKSAEDFLAMQPGETNQYILGNDITLKNYTPLDLEIAEFDGNGRTITIESFATFKDAEIQAGLFKQIYKGMLVKNVNVVYQSVREETVYTFGSARPIKQSSGKVADFNVEYADICKDPTINYTKATFGGLASINNGIVTNCVVSGQIALRASTIEANKSSTSGGNYQINFNVGGLICENSKTGFITNSTSKLKIFALANIGGLVHTNEGKISSSSVEDKATIYAYNTNLERTILADVGGFVVKNGGEISMSHATYNYIYQDTVTPTICYGLISSKDISAGFVHTNSGKISNCYTQLTAIGNNNNTFSGFVSANTGEIEYCYTNINEGAVANSNTYMFAAANTLGLKNCIELVKNPSSYTATSENLFKVEYASRSNRKNYEDKGFVFGDNATAVWSIREGYTPNLVATQEKVVYTENKAPNGNYYYGIRNISYESHNVENEDGSVSVEMKVRFISDSYGSKENPYIIHNLERWETLFYDGTAEYYRIVADIDFGSLSNPYTSTMVFSGNIQGNDMLLSGIKLYLTTTTEGIGLFKELKTLDDISIQNSVRNLKLNTVSVWAAKSNSLGLLAGISHGFNLYNIHIDSDGVNMVGGNAVGGLVGIATGEFNIEGISSNIGVNSTREINTYQYSIYYSRNNSSKTNNLHSVYYAGSIVGILDGYGGAYYEMGERDLSSKYYDVKHIYVNGKPTLVGDTVGGAFGFVGERIKLTNVQVVLTEAAFKGYQYSAGLAGENRGVIENVKVEIESETAFESANYVAAGVVGLNFGGLVRNTGVVKVNIVRKSGSITIGGIVGRNINGLVTNVGVNGKLFGNITGAIIGSDYTKQAFMNNAGSGSITASCKQVNLIADEIKYYENSQDMEANEPIKIENLVIGKLAVDFMFEQINNIYTWDNVNGELIQYCYKAFGLYVGMSNVGYAQDAYYSSAIYDNVSSLGHTVSYKSVIVTINYTNDGEIILNDGINYYEKDKIYAEEELTVDAVNRKYGLAIPSATIDTGVEIVKRPLYTRKAFKRDGLEYYHHVYIVGANVAGFDSWNKESFSNDYVIFASANINVYNP